MLGVSVSVVAFGRVLRGRPWRRERLNSFLCPACPRIPGKIGGILLHLDAFSSPHKCSGITSAIVYFCAISYS